MFVLSCPVLQNREGYSLAAGLALGLLILGRGSTAVGLADLHLEDQLSQAIQGGERTGSTTTSPVALQSFVDGIARSGGAWWLICAYERRQSMQHTQQPHQGWLHMLLLLLLLLYRAR